MHYKLEKIKSKPLGFLVWFIISLFISLFIANSLLPKIFHFYHERNWLLLTLSSIFLLPCIFTIFCLWILIWGKVEVNDDGLKWQLLGPQRKVNWKEVMGCYYEVGEWEESSWFYVLVIETSKGTLRLGPEWTNRNQLYRLIKERIEDSNPRSVMKGD
jgi:hypothetical protein